MIGQELVRRARALGLELALAPGGQLRYRGPNTPEVQELLAQLREHKAEVLLALRADRGFVGDRNLQIPPAPGHPGPVSPLTAAALSQGAHPPCKFTLRETADEEADCQLMARIAQLLSEFPGQDPIVMTIVTLDGRRRRFLWRASVTRELRWGLARLLRGWPPLWWRGPGQGETLGQDETSDAGNLERGEPRPGTETPNTQNLERRAETPNAENSERPKPRTEAETPNRGNPEHPGLPGVRAGAGEAAPGPCAQVVLRCLPHAGGMEGG